MDDLISIIIPIYNAAEYLEESINSLINQSIGCENLEIIMVDDQSSDGSDKIIDEYAKKYDCCHTIHLPKNTGAAHEPRNKGLEVCTGDYIMFLDADDTYVVDACETLYKEVKNNNADIVFGRFRRIFTDTGIVEKSYSPYLDDLDRIYPDDNLKKANPLETNNVMANNIVEKIIYGKNIIMTYERDKKIDKIKINSINDEIDLLKSPPSVWSKIFKRELIMDNNIRFPPCIWGEDTAFILESFLNANGIVFLNDYITYNYHNRDVQDKQSISSSVKFQYIDELMDAFIYCANLTKKEDKRIAKIAITPHLLYWVYRWYRGSFTIDDNKILLKKVYKLKRVHYKDIKSKFVIDFMSFFLKCSIFKKYFFW